MTTASHLFTSESVSEGHPDKIADQISDAILDAYLEQDPDAKFVHHSWSRQQVDDGPHLFAMLRGKVNPADRRHWGEWK